MTKLTTLPPKKRLGAGEKRAANPFLDGELHARMRDYTEREAAIAKELRAIVERGASAQNPDPRLAPSLQSIGSMVKKGLPFSEMLNRIVAGTEKALWEPWLTGFGFELRTVNYAQTGARNACLALDLGVGSKANAVFAKVLVSNWRSLVAEDCLKLHIENATEKTPFKAFAMFYLDPVPK